MIQLMCTVDNDSMISERFYAEEKTFTYKDKTREAAIIIVLPILYQAKLQDI